MISERPSIRTVRYLQWINFDSKQLLVPALFSFWVLCFINFSPPDDWRVSRFGTAPILPPVVLTLVKLLGRGGTIVLMAFCLLSVWKHEKRSHVLAIMSPMLLFGIYGVSSTAWSALKSISLQQSATFMMTLMLATYVGIVWRSDRDTERIVKHLSLAIFSLSIVLIVLHFGMPRSGALTKESSGVLHSTSAGASGGLCILLTIAARLLWRSGWSSWWLPIITIEFGMMMIAGNRLSVIVTLVVVLVLLAIAIHRGIAGLYLLVGAVVIGAYFICDPNLALVEAVGKEIGVYAKQGQSKSELGSFSGRTEMWNKMWASYQGSPLIGHGFFVSTEKGRIYVWYEWGNWTAHNVILQTLVTLGAVGLSLLILAFLVLGKGIAAGARLLEGVENSMKLLFVVSLWYFGWGVLNESFVGPLSPEVVVFAALVGVAAGIGGSARWVASHKNSRELF